MNKKISISPSDHKLLEGLQAADYKTIVQIYDLALPAVINWVKENNGQEADARDIYQEALMVVYSKLKHGDFKLTCTLKSYLRIVCRNLWLSRLRNRKAQKISTLTAIEDVNLEEDLLKKIEASEKLQLYYRHFDQLGDKCQQILQCFFAKVPLKEIANKMNSSEGYIKKRKFICKERLIKAIQTDPLFHEFMQQK